MNVVDDVLWKLLFVLCISGFLMSSGKAGKLTNSYSSDYHDEEPNPTIIEGDIVPDKDLLEMIHRSRGNRRKRVAKRNIHLWDDGLIPYNISTDASDNFRTVLRRAFRNLAAKTCIHFIPKRPTDKYYIYFKQGTGCYSKIGRQDGGQVITLAKTCETRYKAVHEIMHALGFLHEHSRPDRDQYLKILYWNIEQGKNKNFRSYSPSEVDTLSEPYDFDSILHYDNIAFSKNGKDTIQALKNPNLRFGNAKRLSPGNVREIRKLYKCDRRKAKLNGSGQNYICKDKIPGCKSYTERSDACESNYEFLNAYCQQACGFCANG